MLWQEALYILELIVKMLYPGENRIEQIFDTVARDVAEPIKDIASFKTLLDNFNLEGKSVLEVGCGLGDNLIYCARKGAAYAEGFDLSGESVKIAQQKVQGVPNVNFFKCSIEEYASNKQFDLIIAWGVFEYFNEPFNSLKKIVGYLNEKGVIILLISKPVLIKRLSFLFRLVLSKIPMNIVLPAAKLIKSGLRLFSPGLKKTLYTGESNTYSIEQTILEGLMVPRYNVFRQDLFVNYFREQGYAVKYFNGVAPSMTCIIASKNAGAFICF